MLIGETSVMKHGSSKQVGGGERQWLEINFIINKIDTLKLDRCITRLR